MSDIPYVKMSGRQVFHHPFSGKGVEFYGFVLRADTARLQTILRDYLNRPTNYQTNFRPALPYIMLVFNRLRSLTSTKPPDSELGWFSEEETAIWILTVESKHHGKKCLFWFHPYLFVDNSYAMAMGRELYGFPKSIGRFEIPDHPESADWFSTDTLVLKTFSPETKGTWERLFQVQRIKNGDDGPPRLWTDFEEFMEEIVSGLELEKKQRELLLDDFRRLRIPMVFLKQFPDVTKSGGFACYQSIVTVHPGLSHFNQGGFLSGEYRVTINPYDSHPIQSDLGLESDQLTPILSFWVDFDFEIGNGEEIWKAQVE